VDTESRKYLRLMKSNLDIDSGNRKYREAELVVTYIKETPKTSTVIHVSGMPKDW